MTGGDGFERLIEAGYQTALSEVDWEILPSESRPPAVVTFPSDPPIEAVRTTLSVKVEGSWDPLADKPDMVPETTVLACMDCDGYGTSASTVIRGDEKKDSDEASWDLGALLLRPGYSLRVSLTDVDGMSDDSMGAFEIEYEKPGTVVREVAGVSLTVTFERVGD
jgi:hypothetical protein